MNEYVSRLIDDIETFLRLADALEMDGHFNIAQDLRMKADAKRRELDELRRQSLETTTIMRRE